MLFADVPAPAPEARRPLPRLDTRGWAAGPRSGRETWARAKQLRLPLETGRWRKADIPRERASPLKQGRGIGPGFQFRLQRT